MKKESSLVQINLYIVGILLLLGFAACKKSSPGHTASENSFSFTYNGTRYSLDALGEYQADSMNIQITALDIFGAAIIYQKPDCAFYATDHTVVNVSGSCQLTNGSGLPIDSAAVYIYQSGSLNVSYSNCSSESLIDLSGNHVTAQYCDMEGNFDLVLKNNENKLVTISDGHFVQYHMLRSWK